MTNKPIKHIIAGRGRGRNTALNKPKIIRGVYGMRLTVLRKLNPVKNKKIIKIGRPRVVNKSRMKVEEMS